LKKNIHPPPPPPLLWFFSPSQECHSQVSF